MKLTRFINLFILFLIACGKSEPTKQDSFQVHTDIPLGSCTVSSASQNYCVDYSYSALTTKTGVRQEASQYVERQCQLYYSSNLSSRTTCQRKSAVGYCLNSADHEGFTEKSLIVYYPPFNSSSAQANCGDRGVFSYAE